MHFQCGETEPAGPACILTSYVCDSEIDCYDKSDERNCDYSLNKTTDQTNLTSDAVDVCPDFYYLCYTGKCILLVHRCDGTFDCPDGSDELWCNLAPFHRAVLLDYRHRDALLLEVIYNLYMYYRERINMIET